MKRSNSGIKKRVETDREIDTDSELYKEFRIRLQSLGRKLDSMNVGSQ